MRRIVTLLLLAAAIGGAALTAGEREPGVDREANDAEVAHHAVPPASAFKPSAPLLFAAGGPTTTVEFTLAGLNDASSGGFEPPDVQVAAGPGFVVEMANLAERIWRTAGTPQLVVTTPLADFFQVGTDVLTYPRVMYDASSGHWLASIADERTHSVLLAVSRSSDPTGQWTVRAYAAPGCADQPRLGVSDAVVVLAADVFNDCDQGGPAPVLGNELWIINKQQLLSTSGLVASTTYGPTLAYSSVQPVQSLSSTATEYAVSVDNPSGKVVHVLAINGAPPGGVTVQEVQAVPVSPLQQPPAARQPNTATGALAPSIATNDDRVLDAVWERNQLWLTANTGCIPFGDSFVRSCARVIQLSTAPTPSVVFDSDLGFPGAYLFYPTARPDSAGNLVVAVGESSPTILPEVLVLGRAADGTFTDPGLVAQGVAPHLGLRYGDYFGAARDPADPKTVWVAGEAGTDVRGSHGWTTAVASVQVTGPGVAPPASTGAVPPGVRALPATGRKGQTVRLSYRPLDDGSQVKAVLRISRGGTTFYEATTASANLRAGQIYYVLWKPGAKLHGTFAYCVTAVGAGGAKSPQSCTTAQLP